MPQIQSEYRGHSISRLDHPQRWDPHALRPFFKACSSFRPVLNILRRTPPRSFLIVLKFNSNLSHLGCITNGHSIQGLRNDRSRQAVFVVLEWLWAAVVEKIWAWISADGVRIGHPRYVPFGVFRKSDIYQASVKFGYKIQVSIDSLIQLDACALHAHPSSRPFPFDR